MVEPISPNNIVKKVPDFVIEVFNDLIQKNWNGHYAKFTQEKVVVAILKKTDNKSVKRVDIFDNHWLDVEPIYRAKGWKVEYNEPSYCESYKAFFMFKK